MKRMTKIYKLGFLVILGCAFLAQGAERMTPRDLYQKYAGSVFTIQAEGSTGSGFLVDGKLGLIVTNSHVVANTVYYLAVKMDEEKKYMAKVVAEDGAKDLAILRVAPEVVAGMTPLQLATADEVGMLFPGDVVVAIGSPLGTEGLISAGVVSKVEKEAIYSDVDINPGNSGGPLFNEQGKVIGINTFGIRSISGSIRAKLAQKILEQAKLNIQANPPPSANLLPIEPNETIPADELRQYALSIKNFKHDNYHVEAGKFDVNIITPAALAYYEIEAETRAAKQRNKRNKRKKKKVQANPNSEISQVDDYEPGKSFYEWRKYIGDYRRLVRIQAIPEIKMTTGSIFKALFVGAITPYRFRFKTDFDRMELWRGDELIAPYTPSRISQVYSKGNAFAVIEDIEFYGSYTYPVSAFAPGEILTIKVWEQGKEKPKEARIKEKAQMRIWDDFNRFGKSSF